MVEVVRTALLVRAVLAVVVSALFACAVATDLLAGTRVLGRSAVLVVDDLSQLAAASLAALACTGAARRAGAAARSGQHGAAGLVGAWALLAAATGSWAAGQAVWTVQELLLDREMPFPSLADVGFLGFLVLAGAGLVRWLAADVHAVTWVRDVLDGAIIAGSLLVISWVTTLEPVYAVGAADEPGSRLGFLLAVAYPLGDVVLATIVLLTLARSTGGQRTVLLLVAAGLGGLAVSDSVYVYLTAAGTPGLELIGAGWVLGFLLLAVAGSASTARHERRGAGSEEPGDPGASSRAAWRMRALLPYVPMVVAETMVTVRLLTTGRVEVVELGIGVVLVALVLARQFLALDENRRLLEQLAVAQEQLRHQALHDPLTGLADRALFTDRLQHALALRPRAGSAVTVMFCDLDDFKAVNDGLGHAAGDALLRLVADRLRSCLRPGDTVARLGGDEFVVLLEDSPDPHEVAGRLLEAVARPCVVDGVEVRATMSVGVATASSAVDLGGPGAHDPGGALLRRADAAMYRAKAAGKGRVAGAPEGLSGAGSPTGRPQEAGAPA